MLKNVSITNNIVAGLNAYHTALVVNGTSIFHNNIGTDGDGLIMYQSSYLTFHEHIRPYFLLITVQLAEEEPYLSIHVIRWKSSLFFSNSLITHFLNQ